jgi:outer membrane protein W
MKKILLSAALILSVAAFNETFAQKGFSVSVKGTPHFSWLQNSDDNDNSSYNRKATFGTNFGIGAGYNFTNNLGIGMDALYSFQGQKYELSGTEYRQKLQYLKVPVMFTYNTDATRKISFIGKVGPQLSFLTNSELSDNNGNKIADTKEQYKDVTFGAAAVAGAQYHLDKNLFLTTALRYDYDFTNAENKDYAGYAAGRSNTYNTTLGLEVGLKYMLK